MWVKVLLKDYCSRVERCQLLAADTVEHNAVVRYRRRWLMIETCRTGDLTGDVNTREQMQCREEVHFVRVSFCLQAKRK